MKKTLGLLLLVLALLIATPITFSAPLLQGHSIVVNAGHGGSDPGSTECPGIHESVANLDIANRLKALLVADGATVYMTRSDDSYLTNRDRYTYANTTGAEVLVSIHLNGSLDHSLNYTQGLYAKRNKDLDLTQVVHQALVGSLGIDDGGVMQFASGVILKADMPATLQEAVFISNTGECEALTDGTGNRQQQIAQALHAGLVAWFNQPPPEDEPPAHGRPW